MTASIGSRDAPAYASQTEVVTKHRNARFAQAANHGFDVFDLLWTLRTVEQNVVPVRGIDVLDRS